MNLLQRFNLDESSFEQPKRRKSRQLRAIETPSFQLLYQEKEMAQDLAV